MSGSYIYLYPSSMSYYNGQLIHTVMVVGVYKKTVYQVHIESKPIIMNNCYILMFIRLLKLKKISLFIFNLIWANTMAEWLERIISVHKVIRSILRVINKIFFLERSGLLYKLDINSQNTKPIW